MAEILGRIGGLARMFLRVQKPMYPKDYSHQTLLLYPLNLSRYLIGIFSPPIDIYRYIIKRYL